MSHFPIAARGGADRCPGALRVHAAADGGLARVRLPGGIVSGERFAMLAGAADRLGSRTLELTSRQNVQVRGLSEAGARELAGALTGAGLLPSATHERVRNIVASPLSGIDRPPDLTRLVRELDMALCGHERLAALPGRFLFGLDDGRGDIAALGADVTLIACGDAALIAGMTVRWPGAVDTMLALAEAFLDERAHQGTRAWRIDELAGGIGAVTARAFGIRPRGDDRVTGAAPGMRPVGVIDGYDGRRALAVLAPLGRMTPRQALLLSRHAGPRGLRVTPWRGVVLPDLDRPGAVAADLAAAGFGVDAESPWNRVTACAGMPGCASALADVRADARANLGRWSGARVHWAGCPRRCGRPAGTEIDVVATTEGYEIHE